MRRLLFPVVVLLAAVGSWLAAQQPKPAPAADEFARDVLPFVEKHCISCHNPQKKKADLILTAYRDELSVVKNRTVWLAVAKMVQAGEMPPQTRPRPAAAEMERFGKAVAAILDRADRSARRDPGRVTIRRLNRTEYNNTIRDLTGVDFQPAEDFPSDDVGYGFDNIGDVLSLSPVLMERYLTAAESVVQRAVLTEAPKPPQHPAAATFLLPRGREREPATRSLTDSRESLYFLYKITQPGEYVFRVRGYGKSPDQEMPRIALLLDGKRLATHEVKSTNARFGDAYEANVTLKEGEYRAEATLLNPSSPTAVSSVEKGSKRDSPAPSAERSVRKDSTRAVGDRGVKKDSPGPSGERGVRKDVDRRPTERAKGPGDGLRTVFVRRFEMEGPKDSYPPSHRKIMACDVKAPHAEQTREILARFAGKAYRHPATRDEVSHLVQLVEAAEKRGDKWEVGIQLALEAILVSPKFLFRVELDDRPDGTGPHGIDEYQLASRLSYFLWSTMPDDELLALAGKKQLGANLDAQVRRMLQDPRSRALTDNFAMQWLQLRTLKNFSPDPQRFPNFDEELRAAMLKETELFFDAVVHEDRSILDFIDADFTFLNRRLSEHYGIADTNGNLRGRKATRPEGDRIWRDRFVRVQLQGSERGGLLTQASVLAVTSNPTRTSPVKRGRWVLEQLLGTPPPPPPPNVPPLEDTRRQLTGSLRQRMTQHMIDPACANCHARMDPLGFGLENFDAIGAYRTKDDGFPIDPSGTLPDGRSFKGPADLKQILKGKKELFCRNLSEKLLTYALGRGLEYYDRPTIERVNAALAKNGYRFSTLVMEIVKSDPFRLRRGRE
jgi:hypothetical protein